MKKFYNFETANEQHARTLVVFAKTADSKLYYEAEYTNQVSKEDAEHFFCLNSLVVKTATGYAIPVAISSTKVTTVLKGASAVEATEWAFKA